MQIAAKDDKPLEFDVGEIPYDSIIIPRAPYGMLSAPAIVWLANHGLSVRFIRLNGEIYSELLPQDSQLHGLLRYKQYETFQIPTKRLHIASQIVKAKIESENRT